jgi:hypothetical protein
MIKSAPRMCNAAKRPKADSHEEDDNEGGGLERVERLEFWCSALVLSWNYSMGHSLVYQYYMVLVAVPSIVQCIDSTY